MGRDALGFQFVESSFTSRRGASIYCRGAAQVLSAQPVNGRTLSGSLPKEVWRCDV